MEQIGAKNPPEMGRMEGADIKQPIIDYVAQDFLRIIRELNNSPDVAYGKVDSSIRSALTLSFLLKPLSDVANVEKKLKGRATSWSEVLGHRMQVSVRVATALMREAAPAAARQWPKLALHEPRNRSPPRPGPCPKKLPSDRASTRSPTLVPVPWHSRYETVTASTPASS